MVCPNCGSTNVKVELRSAGTKSRTNYYRTGVRRSWLIPSGVRSYSSQRKHTSIGICQNCGHNWSVSGTEHGCLFYVICVLFLPITILVLLFRWIYTTPIIPLGKGWRILIIVLCFVLLGAVVSTLEEDTTETLSSDPTENAEEVKWSETYTPLTDFEFYIDGDSLNLKKYRGNAQNINIAPVYEVEGRSFPVVSLNSTFQRKSIQSVIVPEGVLWIDLYAFDRSGVKRIFLPSSLDNFSGWNYIEKVDKLYYGGSEEAWKKLFQWDRSRLDVVEVIYNATVDDILSS